MAKVLIGTVDSIAMKNTVVVKVQRSFPHPIYKKIIKRDKKYKVDHHNPDIKIGDTVGIEECRPVSKEKHFRIKTVIKSL